MTDSDGSGASVLSPVALEVVLHAGSDASWELFEATIREGLSELYECALLLGCDDACPDLGALLGQRLTLRLRRDGLGRNLHGVVRKAEELDERHRDGRTLVRLWVVPELWFLSKRHDTRIFAHQTVPDIVRAVLDAASLYAGDALARHLDTGATTVHATREYCVQYQETDLDFIRRLLEEEGTTFYFEHGGDERETLVLSDGQLGPLEGTYVPLDNGDGGSELRWAEPHTAELDRLQTVHRFNWHAEVQSTAVTLRDHDFTHTRDRRLWTAERSAPDGRELPVYEHPGRMIFQGPAAALAGLGPAILERAAGELMGASAGRLGAPEGDTLGELVRANLPRPPYPPLPGHSANTGLPLAVVRLEEQRGKAYEHYGSSNVIGMAAGHWFDLTDHPRSDLDRRYLLTQVEHEIRSAAWADAVSPLYVNRFRCRPRDVVFRPSRTTPKPRAHGTQTATVVGGPGEEMHVDAFGRVRVQFHWDRQHRYDEGLLLGLPAGPPQDVCWVRCAQAWAGPHWGSVFIPRVGMEVVVTFLDGDPDRPLVVGCVYNDANPPPYQLPGNFHRSTIMSRSLPSIAMPGGRIGFNELRFDDLAGREQIYVHAEKDLTEVVRNHHETYVGGSHDVEVARHETLHVGGTQTENIVCNQMAAIGGHQAVGVALNRELRVNGVEYRVAAAGRMSDAGSFDGELIRGGHLHYVLPRDVASPESRPEVAAMLRAMRSAAAAMGDPAEPPGEAEEIAGDLAASTGVPDTAEEPEGETEADAEDSDEDGAQDSSTGAVLEVYVVEGDRHLRITGHQREQLGSRGTTVSGPDRTTVDGRLQRTAETVTITATGGTTKGIALLAGEGEGDKVRIFRGGDQFLLMVDQGVVLANRNDQFLHMSPDAFTILRDKQNPVKVYHGEDDTLAELELDASKARLFVGDPKKCEIEVTNANIKIDADSEVKLQNKGGASITLNANGTISIHGDVDIQGRLTTT